MSITRYAIISSLLPELSAEDLEDLQNTISLELHRRKGARSIDSTVGRRKEGAEGSQSHPDAAHTEHAMSGRHGDAGRDPGKQDALDWEGL